MMLDFEYFRNVSWITSKSPKGSLRGWCVARTKSRRYNLRDGSVILCASSLPGARGSVDFGSSSRECGVFPAFLGQRPVVLRRLVTAAVGGSSSCSRGLLLVCFWRLGSLVGPQNFVSLFFFPKCYWGRWSLLFINGSVRISYILFPLSWKGRTRTAEVS